MLHTLNDWWAGSSHTSHWLKSTLLVGWTSTIVQITVRIAECLTSFLKYFASVAIGAPHSSTRIYIRDCDDYKVISVGQDVKQNRRVPLATN